MPECVGCCGSKLTVVVKARTRLFNTLAMRRIPRSFRELFHESRRAASRPQGEKQYRESVQKIKRRGNEQLGIMGSWAYLNDPKRLALRSRGTNSSRKCCRAASMCSRPVAGTRGLPGSSCRRSESSRRSIWTPFSWRMPTRGWPIRGNYLHAARSTGGASRRRI